MTVRELETKLRRPVFVSGYGTVGKRLFGFEEILIGVNTAADLRRTLS